MNKWGPKCNTSKCNRQLQIVCGMANGPCAVFRDFNTILNADEKKGGVPHTFSKILDFISCMDDCGLMVTQFTGSAYTCCNGRRMRWRISMRLDREQEGFVDVVKEVWDNEITGNPMWRLQNKLKNLSKALSKWSKECIGDVYDIVKQKEEHNKLMEKQYEMNNPDHNRILFHKYHTDYIKWLKLQDSILRQKARVKWADKGETNSKGRRRDTQILMIKDSTGKWLDNTDQISQAEIDYFSNIFTHSNDTGASSDSFLRYLYTLVTDIDNDFLEAIPTEEEVKAAIFSMDPNSSVGLDEYKVCFFSLLGTLLSKTLLNM
ncbi:hypothetical protein KY289_030690 [Solanum tuberosum]|nr:hypothetical protein KY289_030690 [Solanum tuberosum]